MVRKIFSEVAFYSVGELMFRVAPFVVLPFVARSIGPEGMGFADILLSISAMCASVLTLGAGSAVHRFYAQPQIKFDEKSSLITTAFWLTVFLASAGAVSLYFLGEFLIRSQRFKLSGDVLLASVAIVFFSPICQYFLDVLRIHSARAKYMLVSGIGKLGGLAAILLFVVVFKFGLSGYIFGSVASIALSALLGGVVLWPVLTGSFNWALLKKIVRYGWPLAMLAPAQWAISSLDRIFIGASVSISAAGVYAISAKIANIPVLAISSVLMAFSPSALKMQNNQEGLNKAHALAFNVLVIVFSVAVLGAYFFGERIVDLLFSSAYKGAHIYLPFLIVGSALPFVSSVLFTYISLAGRTHVYLVISLSGAILSTLLNGLIVPKEGAAGAAMVSVVVGVMIFTVNYLAARMSGAPAVGKITIGGLCAVVGLIVILGMHDFGYLKELSF